MNLNLNLAGGEGLAFAHEKKKFLLPHSTNEGQSRHAGSYHIPIIVLIELFISVRKKRSVLRSYNSSTVQIWTPEALHEFMYVFIGL